MPASVHEYIAVSIRIREAGVPGNQGVPLEERRQVSTPEADHRGRWQMSRKNGHTPAPVVDMEPTDLMKGMGGNGWWNPVSNDQITWPMAIADEQAVPRTIHRMFAWLMAHTVTRGNRRPYANQEGAELHLENMGSDLSIEIHNLRTHWRTGVRMGLWRGGTETEGTRKLYPCAKVAPVADTADESDPENPQKGVCTNPRFTIFQQLRPYLREQLESRPVAVQEQAAIRLERIAAVEKLAHAEVVAAIRTITTQQEDTLWSELGIEKIRQNGAKKDQTPEEAAEASERQRRIDGLLPHVEGFVQTLEGFVHIEKPTLYNTDSRAVQTPSVSPGFPENSSKSSNGGRLQGSNGNAATLSGFKNTKRGEEVSRHPSSSAADVEPVSKPLPTKGRSSYTHPEPPAEPEPKVKIDEETKAGLKQLAELIEHAQQFYKHTDFGLSEFDPISKSGQLFLLRVITAIGGPARVAPFWSGVIAKFKGLDRNALGKLPPRPPGGARGPRGLGLLFEWAKDFGRAKGASA
jgi:hypothetical protein